MFGIWSKSNCRRNAIRGSRPQTTALWRILRERGGFASIGIAAIFCIILAAMFMLRDNVVRYRHNEYVPYDITARVDFHYHNKELHENEVTMAREATPHVYRQLSGDIWTGLEAELLALPDRMHDLRLDQLDPPLKDILDSGALTQLEQDRLGAARRHYNEDVRSFINDAKNHLSLQGRPLVILEKPDRDQELARARTGDAHPMIILRPRSAEDSAQHAAGPDTLVDVVVDTCSTELTASVRKQISDYATRDFSVGLASKIAAITADKLKSHPTHQLDTVATAAAQNEAADHVDPAHSDIQYYRNTVIVLAGNIDDAKWQILRAENDAYHKSLTSTWLGLLQYRAGLALIAVVITLVLCAYVVRYQTRCVRNHTRGITICALLLLMLTVSQLAAIGSSELLIFGIAPTILAAMILTIAFDQRFAIGVSTIQAIIVTVALNQNVGFFLVLWTGVLTTCYMLDEIRTRSKLIEVGGAAALAMMFVTAAVCFIELEPRSFIINNCLYAGAAGLAAGFVVLGILPFIEKIFRITTAMTLLELADASQPLLRRLALEAPGTYNHSLQVATLSETAAEAIGGNSLACRVGAYYHDIGKINKADYFVENQLGAPSRHLNLTPDLSLRIIIGHVKDGVEMAKEYNLPSSLLPFIHQHHGTTLVEYFYHAAQEKSQSDQPGISEYHFRYPGPKPKSKETAIVMIADAVESASRAMTEPTASRIEKLVHELALKRLLDGQFDECDLTMRDLETVERALVKTLLGIYHGRIAYPTSAPASRPATTVTAKTA